MQRIVWYSVWSVGVFRTRLGKLQRKAGEFLCGGGNDWRVQTVIAKEEKRQSIIYECDLIVGVETKHSYADSVDILVDN